MAGLTSEGFVKKTLDEIKTEIEESLKNRFGIFINLLPGSVFNILVGIYAERESLIWDLAEDVYYSQYPDTADGANLDNAVGLTGITRLAAARSTIDDVFLFGTAGTLVPSGTQFSVDGNSDALFRTINNVTLGSGTNEVQTIEFSATPDAGSFTLTYRGQTTSAIPYTANAAAVASALNALSNLDGVSVTGSFASDFVVTFINDAGLQPQSLITGVSSLTVTSNPVDIDIVVTTAGVAQASVNVESVETGEIPAPLYSLTVIDTPVFGLDSVINTTEVVLGRDIESDEELRIRRRNTLQVAGAATVEAIRSKLLNLVGVRDAIVFENDTNVTDGDGRPPKSFEAVVDGGDEDEIAEAIWLVKPAGIETFGSETIQIIDSMSNTRDINFSRPTVVPIFVEIDLTVDGTFPVNGTALAQAAIVQWGNTLIIGQDVVVYPQLVAQLNGITGILDVSIRIGKTINPTLDDNITIAPFEVAEFTEANTEVIEL